MTVWSDDSLLSLLKLSQTDEKMPQLANQVNIAGTVGLCFKMCATEMPL